MEEGNLKDRHCMRQRHLELVILKAKSSTFSPRGPIFPTSPLPFSANLVSPPVHSSFTHTGTQAHTLPAPNYSTLSLSHHTLFFGEGNGPGGLSRRSTCQSLPSPTTPSPPSTLSLFLETRFQRPSSAFISFSPSVLLPLPVPVLHLLWYSTPVHPCNTPLPSAPLAGFP